MFAEEIKEYYSDEFFRASSYIKTIWKEIESEILYIIGLSDSCFISVNADDECIIITVANTGNVVYTKNISHNIDHVMTKDFFTEVHIDIDFENVCDDMSYFRVENCTFYHLNNNVTFYQDNGEIKSKFFIKGNFDLYESFKERMLCELAYEIQHCIQYNLVYNNTFEKYFTKDKYDTDALYESVNCTYISESYDFKEKLLMCLTQEQICVKSYHNLLELHENIQKSLKGNILIAKQH